MKSILSSELLRPGLNFSPGRNSPGNNFRKISEVIAKSEHNLVLSQNLTEMSVGLNQAPVRNPGDKCRGRCSLLKYFLQ